MTSGPHGPASSEGKPIAHFDLDSYLAGIFDGEGTVTVYVTDRKHQTGWTQVRISVRMTDQAPLKLFAKRFGGNVSHERRNAQNRKPIYRWNLCGKKAFEAITILSKLCLIKTPQLKLALEAIPLLFGPSFRKVPTDNLDRRISIAREVARLKRIPVDDALGVS